MADKVPHPSHSRGRDKFVDPVHAWMPPALPAWREALAAVDRSRPAKRGQGLWGYWIPEPALLLGPKTEERARRYLAHWLRVRAAWTYLLASPEPTVTRVQPQWWRDLLNGDTVRNLPEGDSRRAQRLVKVKEVFGKMLDIADYVGLEASSVMWFSYRVEVPEPSLCPVIVWELHELGFRYELLALDRVLVPACDEVQREDLLARVFPNHDLYTLHTLPSTGIGLSAHLPQARARFLEALRQVVVRWPLCPNAVRGAEPLALTTAREYIQLVEKSIISFYVETFFNYSGRAPIVPHAFPL